MAATHRAARTVTATVVLVACVVALLEPHTTGRTHHAYGSWQFSALPVAHAQVQKEQDVRLQQLIVTAFTAEAQVASSSARFLQIMEDGINPAQLKSLVLSNTGMSSVVYGSAIAYAPGAYDFVVNNITTGVESPSGTPMSTPRLDDNGQALYCPYAYRGAEWTAGKPFQSMDLAVAYDYTSAGTEWYLAPRAEFASGDGTALKGHWSEPYFDAGAGNVSMATYSVAFTTTKNLTSIGSPHHDGQWFLGVATIDVLLSHVARWTPWTHDSGLAYLNWSLDAVTVLATLAVMAIIMKYRNLRVMKASSPVFNILMLVGLLLIALGSATFVIVPTSTNAVCQMRIGVASMGMITVVAPLFAKTYRIARIFDNKKLKAISLPDRDLLRPTFALIAVQGLLVVAWLVAGGKNAPHFTIVRVDDGDTYWEVPTCSESNAGLGATVVLYGVLLGVGAWFAYRSRKAPIMFNESTQVLACIAFLVGYSALLIPLFFMIKSSDYDASALLRSLGLVVGDWLVLGVLFAPKLLALRRTLKKGSAKNATSGSGFTRMPSAGGKSTASSGSGSGRNRTPVRSASHTGTSSPRTGASAATKSSKSAKPGKATKHANGAATLSTPAGNGRSSGSGTAGGSVELVPTQANGAGNDRTWKVNPVVADTDAGPAGRV